MKPIIKLNVAAFGMALLFHFFMLFIFYTCNEPPNIIVIGIADVTVLLMSFIIIGGILSDKHEL